MSSKISSIVDDVKTGRKTARQYVDEAIARTEADETNAVISIVATRARQRADEIDALLQAGKPAGKLAGVPFIAKDNFLTFGGKTTAASNMLRDFEAPYQSTAIEKLEAAGAICIGKANLDAFAHGSSTENSDFGPTKNPHDTARVPGGSSGGSAAAVAAGIVPFALGTDTGGSVRLPASFCGVVGIKPTYGLVSRFGVVAMASSTDCIGAFANSADDVACILNVIAGQDPRDGTTIQRSASYLLDAELPKLKIGVIKEYMGEGTDSEVRAGIERQLERLKAFGHEINYTSIPEVESALAVYYVVVPAEISSNLARYDGIRYGHRSQKAANLQETYGLSRAEGFNEENTRRIMIGNYVLSSGYYDAYYRKAQTVRTLLVRAFERVFSNYDVLVGPVAPRVAFKFGENKDPLAMYLTDIMTISASLIGIPALSVPAGTAHGMPVGLQIMGRSGDDRLALALAKQIEGGDNE